MKRERISFRMHPIFKSSESGRKMVLSRKLCRGLSPGTKGVLVKARQWGWEGRFGKEAKV